MKIYEWNIGMAATIPSNQGYILMPWVIDEIIKDNPDCIVLTEFVISIPFLLGIFFSFLSGLINSYLFKKQSDCYLIYVGVVSSVILPNTSSQST